MGLFDSIFGNKTNKVDNKYEELDYSDQEAIADSVTIGWEYNANFMLRTPKICLENNGKRTNTIKKPQLIGEPQQYGASGAPMGYHGWWSRLTDIEDDVNDYVDISNNPLYAFPSDIGRINPKTKLEKDFLSYLIDFRTIVESDMTIEEKLYQINDVMSQSSKAYKDIYKQLVTERGFPDSFFTDLLCELDGVGYSTANLLWDAGYLTPEAVKNAPDEELLNIKGIGKKLVKKIKS
tara:strand:+ start:311 stop:1018 length:708 start_codon:yes stop_codon:yes gene_type:complete